MASAAPGGFRSATNRASARNRGRYSSLAFSFSPSIVSMQARIRARASRSGGSRKTCRNRGRMGTPRRTRSFSAFSRTSNVLSPSFWTRSWTLTGSTSGQGSLLQLVRRPGPSVSLHHCRQASRACRGVRSSSPTFTFGARAPARSLRNSSMAARNSRSPTSRQQGNQGLHGLGIVDLGENQWPRAGGPTAQDREGASEGPLGAARHRRRPGRGPPWHVVAGGHHPGR